MLEDDAAVIHPEAAARPLLAPLDIMVLRKRSYERYERIPWGGIVGGGGQAGSTIGSELPTDWGTDQAARGRHPKMSATSEDFDYIHPLRPSPPEKVETENQSTGSERA